MINLTLISEKFLIQKRRTVGIKSYLKIIPVSKQLDSSLPFVNKKRLVVGKANGLAAQLNCDFVAVTNQPKIVPL